MDTVGTPAAAGGGRDQGAALEWTTGVDGAVQGSARAGVSETRLARLFAITRALVSRRADRTSVHCGAASGEVLDMTKGWTPVA